MDLEKLKVDFGKEKNGLQDSIEDLKQQKAKVDKEMARVEKEDQKLSDWAEELDDLKERLLAEREKVVSDKSGLTMGKNEMQQQEKQLAAIKAEIERWRGLQEQEIADTKEAAQEDMDRLENRKENLHKEYEEIEAIKTGLERKKAELAKLKMDMDKESLALWKDRTKLTNDQRDWLTDLENMQQEFEWEKTKFAEDQEDYQLKLSELDGKVQEANDYEDELETREIELEMREKKLLEDKEDFTNTQKSIMEKLMTQQKSGKKSSSEIKQLGAELGLDLNKIQAEQKELQEERHKLDEQMSHHASRRASRRPSQLPSQRMSRRSSRDSQASYAVHRELEIKAQHHKNKTCVRDFLSNLYIDASNTRIMEDLQKRESELSSKDQAFSELQGKLGQAEKDNKILKKQMAVKDKLVDEVRKGSKFDIDALLKVKIDAFTDTAEMEANAGGDGTKDRVVVNLNKKLANLEKECVKLRDGNTKLRVDAENARKDVKKSRGGKRNSQVLDTKFAGDVVEKFQTGELLQARPDGVTVEARPNGDVVEKRPTGEVIKSLHNGSVIVKEPWGETIEYKPTGEVTKTLPSGDVIETKVSGETITTSPMYLVKVRAPNGKLTEKFVPRGPEESVKSGLYAMDIIDTRPGVIIEERPNGDRVEQKPNQDFVETKANHEVIVTKPNGDVIEIRPNGDIIENSNNGTITVHKPSGEIIETKPNGETTESKPLFKITTKAPNGEVKEGYVEKNYNVGGTKTIDDESEGKDGSGIPPARNTLGMSDVAEPTIKDNIVKLPTLDYDDRNLVAVDDAMGYTSEPNRTENFTSGHNREEKGAYPHQKAGDVPRNARESDMPGGQPLYSQVQPMVNVAPVTAPFQHQSQPRDAMPQNYTSGGQPVELKYSTDGSGMLYPSNGALGARDKSGFVDPVDAGRYSTNQSRPVDAPGPNQGMYVDPNTGKPVYMPADELSNLVNDRNRITESLRDLLGNLRLEDLGDMSRNDMKDQIKNIHLLVFDYVQAVSKAILEMNEMKDDYDQEVVEAIAKTIDETPMAQIDVALGGEDNENLKKR